MRKILVGHDGSPASAAATRLAAEMARAYGARMVLFRAVPPLVFPGEIPPVMLADTTQQLVQRARAELELLAGRLRAGVRAVQVESLVLESEPAGAIARLAAEDAGVGLVAIGTTGKTAAKRFLLGSVAYRLVHLCPRPLAVAPAPPDADADVPAEEVTKP